jgi:valyl-tRNA synthetase
MRPEMTQNLVMTNNTPNTQLDKNFDRHVIEQKWSKAWIENNLFVAGLGSDQKKEPYVIMMPPPNVTGVLHNGHALFVTLEDILARFWRMKGRDVLWLPGTDHAGISTQTVVERELKKKEGKSRHDLGREAFLARVFAWKDKHGSHIVEQLKLMGASADWSRLRFTMDEQCSYAVRTAFVKLWEDGLIYRKERLVSWDPSAKTALSNEEVDHVERAGELYYFAYKIKNNPTQEIIVATTRVETMLGDTGVAVNAKDERYKNLIGCELIHPFCADRVIKIIADDHVDPEFGSGAVKITPAHDPNDFAIGERHNLASINIFTLDAVINEKGGQFKGLDRFAARKAIKEELNRLGLFRKSEQINHAVAISQRSGVDIEPMLSRQYFVDARVLAKKALEATESGEVRIIPASFKKIWDHFLQNIQDWCISRQLWWGHRIPVYYNINKLTQAIKDHGPSQCLDALNNNRAMSEVLRLALDELDEKTIRSFSESMVEEPLDAGAYIQEEDVLDTWFSSGLWPMSTLGWPHQTPDLKRYYPGSVLETGSDILFFWVARMVMFGKYFMGEAPFKDIFLHAMVRDAQGRKMSKSLGNTIDPIDVIEGISLEALLEKTRSYPVPENYLPKVLDGIKKEFPEGIPSAGADGLRLSLAMFSGQGRDVKFSIPRVIGYRAFLNKVWNATRFALMNIPEGPVLSLSELMPKLSLADRFIISTLNKTIQKVDSAIQEYKFNEAAEAIYQFFWNEYCDKYIEYAKVSFKHDSQEQQKISYGVLIYLLDESMRMLHPFCPFISEEIWQILPITRADQSFCARAPFPEVRPDLINIEAEARMELVFQVCSMINNARQSSDLPANLAVPVNLYADTAATKNILEENYDLITHMAKTSQLEIFLRGTYEVSELSALNTSSEVDVVVLLKGLIDIDKELGRLSNALQKLAQQKAGLEQRLANKAFVNNAPPEVVKTQQLELAALIAKEEQLILGRERLAKQKS